MIRLLTASVLALLSFLQPVAQAQQSGSSTTSSPSQEQSGTPIDVPDIIIKGSATIKLMATSFSKQGPANTRVLSRAELDSLNPLEKQAPKLLARTAAPGEMLERKNYRALFEASMGIFQTPDVVFSYGSSFSEYAFYVQGDYHSSAGYSTNTEFMRAALHLDLRYKEPEGDGIFAGSVTTSSVDLGSQNYLLFARLDSVPERRVQNISIGVQMINRHYSYPYEASLRFASTGLREELTQRSDLRETALQGTLLVEHPMGAWKPGLFTRLDIRPTGDHTISGNELGLSLANRSEHYQLHMELGAATLSNSKGEAEADLIARLRAEFPLTNELSIMVAFRRNPEATFLSSALQQNPYLNSLSDLSAQRISGEAMFGLRYSAGTSLEMSTSLSYASYSSMAMMELDSLRTFRLSYNPATLLQIYTEALIHIGSQSSLTAGLRITSASRSDSGFVPYRAPFEASVRFHSTFLERLQTDVQLAYVGARNVSGTRDETVSSYMTVNASLRYLLAETLSLGGRVENLTNSSIFVFEKYRERGAFASLGLEWKF